MRTHLVKCFCVAVLFVAFGFWHLIAGYEFPIRTVVCAGAAVVAIQAFHSAKYSWTIGFFSIALIFNPALPILPLAGGPGLVAITLAAGAFAVSLTKLKSLPLLSIPSITDRNPGSESL
jgi:hypothetical protein